MFVRWGRLVYRYRWVTLLLSTLLLIGAIGVVLQGGTLRDSTQLQTESLRAYNLMGAQLPQTSGGGTTFSLIMGSDTLHARDARFQQAVAAALAPLQRNDQVQTIVLPYTLPAAQAAPLISRDGRQILVRVTLRDGFDAAKASFAYLRGLVRSPLLTITATDNLVLSYDYDTYLNSDLSRAERVSLPLALILLLLVFGTLVAALLPLGVGVSAIIGGLAGVYTLTRFTDVSQYALNIVTLIGLGVAIDYSLFIVTRFRDELALSGSVEVALSRAMGTAGRAVAFSGLTVAIGLAGLLFYHGTVLASMGLAGTLVVAFAVVYALTFLPALLALLGPRINAGRLPLGRLRAGSPFWGHLARAVMRRPVRVLAVALPLLLLAGSPFLSLRLASGNASALPPSAESHRGNDLLQAQFPGVSQTTIQVVVHYHQVSPFTAARIGALYDLSRQIAALPHVLRVESVVTIDPSLRRSDYQHLLSQPATTLPPAMQAAVVATSGPTIVVLNVLTAEATEGDRARAIVRGIRQLQVADAHLLVTGDTAYDLDTIAVIEADTGPAIVFIIGATYLVLFLLLGSVILPLKAVLTDILSISTSFGALVWVFQQGHLSQQLNFSPGSIDPLVPILLFCIVFGLSMDYEVLLLSRIKEVYEATGDNRRAVAEGLERSGRLISGAAAIMIVVFLAFGLADVVFIKAIGLGMALAVAVDATIVRAVVVPAIMRLLGTLNWWAPQPLARAYRWLDLGEGPGRAVEEAPQITAGASAAGGER